MVRQDPNEESIRTGPPACYKMGMADTEFQSVARLRAAEIIKAAEAEAEALLEDAEQRARERADEVIEQYQARLNGLFEEERAIRTRLAELGVPSSDQQHDEGVDLVDDRDAMNGIDVEPDASLADFMKATLRHEIESD